MTRFAKLLFPALLFSTAFAVAQDTAEPASSAPTASQRQQARGDQASRRLKRLTKRLDLTAEQQERIRPILQDEAAQMKAVNDDSALTQQQKHRKIRDLRQATRSQLDGILTDEQKQKLASNKPHGGYHHGRRGQTNQGTSTPQTTSPDQSNPQ